MIKTKVYTSYKGLSSSYDAKIDIIDESSEREFENKYLADYSFIQNELKHMLGKTLTLIDASIAGAMQNKAVKDTVKQMYIDEYCNLSNRMFNKKYWDKLKVDIDNSPAEEVSIDEALDIE